MGITKCGIRLDSGDMTYLSRKARKMLDEAGLDRVSRSLASNALDEYLIQDLLRQGACIDILRRRRAAHHRPQRAGLRRRL